MDMMRPDAEMLWEVAQTLARDAAGVSPPPRRALPPLLFFTDPVRTPRPWETAAGLPHGAGVVFRHFGATDAYETGLRLRKITTDRRLLLLIGLDADMADAVGADGVHLPERALDQAQGLSLARPDWLLSGAVHETSTLSRIDALDAVVISPVFRVEGASAVRPALGLSALASLVRASPKPAYALGGVTAENARSLIGSGVQGLAAVSAIQAAFGP